MHRFCIDHLSADDVINAPVAAHVENAENLMRASL
jgi:hypothetical protein